MNKLEIVKYDPKDFNIDYVLKTKYDNLFEDRIRHRGGGYYLTNKVTNFTKTKNKISAIVKGTEDYNVSIEYKSNNIIVHCDCPYHKETNQYCKHVYSLLIKLKMIYKKRETINIFNSNIKRIKEIEELINVMITENEKYLEKSYISLIQRLVKNNNDHVREMGEYLIRDNDIKVLCVTKDSYNSLNFVIDLYNELIDKIEEEKERYKQNEEKQKQEKEKNKKSSSTYVLDIGLEDIIVDHVSNLDLNLLEKVRKENKYIDEDTELLDKAISLRKQKNEIIKGRQKRNQELYEEQNKMMKKYKRISLFYLLSNIFDGISSSKKSSSNTDYLMPWEQDLVNKGEYEPYNFEEEELEEDDYYYDDE